MRIVKIQIDQAPHLGIVTDQGIKDITTRLGTASLKDLLANDEIRNVASDQKSWEIDYPTESVQFLSLAEPTSKIICVGVNYHNRNEEYKDGSAAPAYPSVFPRFPQSFVGHAEPIICPLAESDQLDYEGEIALIIGKKGRRIAKHQAHEHIAGLTCLNEGSVRDWIRHGKFNVTQGKNFDSSGSIGPWMLTSDEIDSFDDLEIITRVNGEQRQRDNTRHLMFPFDDLIQYISRWTTLEPGDIISTGTPIGAGIRFDPPRFLKQGDVVEVEVPQIGILRNTIKNG